MIKCVISEHSTQCLHPLLVLALTQISALAANSLDGNGTCSYPTNVRKIVVSSTTGSDLHFFAFRAIDGATKRNVVDVFRVRDVAFSKAASFCRYSMAAMRRSTERTLSRYSSSFCWSPCGNLRRRSFAPPMTRSSIWRSSGSVAADLPL